MIKRGPAVDAFLNQDLGTNSPFVDIRKAATEKYIAADRFVTTGIGDKASNLAHRGAEKVRRMRNSVLNTRVGSIGGVGVNVGDLGRLSSDARGMGMDRMRSSRLAKSQVRIAGIPVSGAELAGATGRGAKAAGSGLGKFVGMNAAFAGAFTAMDYAMDPKADHFGSKMTANTIGFIGDDLMGRGASLGVKGVGFGLKALGARGVGGALMGMSGPIGIAATIALHTVGAGASAMIGAHHDRTMNQMKSVQRGGRMNIEQNKRTMQATQSQMALLGQAGNYSMLGNEAQMMHT